MKKRTRKNDRGCKCTYEISLPTRKEQIKLEDKITLSQYFFVGVSWGVPIKVVQLVSLLRICPFLLSTTSL